MRLKIFSSVFIILATLPYPLLAAGGDIGISFVYKLINFGILVLLLFLFVRKPVKNIFQNIVSQKKIELEEAKARADQAQKEAAEYKKKLRELENWLEIMTKEAIEAADVEKKQIIEEARVSAERIQVQAETQIQQNLNQAKNDLKELLMSEAMKIAESQIKDRVDDQVEEHLASVFNKALKEAK